MSSLGANNFDLRTAGPADADRLSLIANASFLESFAGIIDGESLLAHCAEKHAPSQWQDHLRGGAKLWLAEMNGSPVGYAMLAKPDLEAARDGDVELRKIYVLSRFHGEGLAEKLLARVLHAAAGSQRILLGVKADNLRAIGFYKKHHFHQIATRQYNIGGVWCDDFVLARDLSLETPT